MVDVFYKGEAAEDAPETRAIAGFINNLAQSPAGAKMYTDWHSYSQLFLFRKS
jgi:carboxypeptidase A4